MILALDSSAKTAGAALIDNGKIISECFTSCALTHSKTLLVMVDNCLRQAGKDFSQIDKIAVNCGPGSFTGVRIGVAMAKGLAFERNIGVAPVSTLESMAYNFTDENCLVFSLMDARRQQFYFGEFEIQGGEVTRRHEDSALSFDEIKGLLFAESEGIGENGEISESEGIKQNEVKTECKEIKENEGEGIKENSKKIYLAGDGAELFYKMLEESGEVPKIVILPGEGRRYQRAYGAGLCAEKNNIYLSPEEISPVYLRLSQAERERKEGHL